MSKTVVEIRGKEYGDGSKDLAEKEFQEAGVKYFYLKKTTEKEMFLKTLSEWSGNPADLIAVSLTTKLTETVPFLRELRDLSEETRKKLIIFWTRGNYIADKLDSFCVQNEQKLAQEAGFHSFHITKSDGTDLIRRILDKLEETPES